MANYFVLNNTFRPYTFDELIRPYQMYAKEYDTQEALLDAAREKEFSNSLLDREADAEAYKMWEAANTGLKEVSDELSMKGLSAGLRGRLRSTARDYKSTMDTLSNAQEQLNKERARRANLGPDYIYQQENLRIGDFLGGNTPNQNSASLKDITNSIASEFKMRAGEISESTWNKVLGSNGRVISGYYDVATKEGLTSAQLDTILNTDDDTWKAMMSNPTIPDSQKQQLQGFRNAIISKKASIGYDSYSDLDKSKIDNAISVGATAGIGGTKHEEKIDRSYNPELWFRMKQYEEEKPVREAELKYKEALLSEKQRELDVKSGNSPYYTETTPRKDDKDEIVKDEKGNVVNDVTEYYTKDNKTYWATKNGKTLYGPMSQAEFNKIHGVNTPTTKSQSSINKEIDIARTFAFTLKEDGNIINKENPQDTAPLKDFDFSKSQEVSLGEIPEEKREKIKSLITEKTGSSDVSRITIHRQKVKSWYGPDKYKYYVVFEPLRNTVVLPDTYTQATNDSEEKDEGNDLAFEE